MLKSAAMNDINLNFQDVINDLAEQVKRLTVDNAVMRAALQAVQKADAEKQSAAPAETVISPIEAD